MTLNSSKLALHFSHANSFPAGSYRKFLSYFEADYDVGFLEMLGHNPDYPVSDCWPALIDESVAFIASRYNQPVIAVGHSLGGFVSFMCALRRPDLFRSLVLLDSPIFSRRVSSLLWLGKRLGFIDRITPGRGTRTRRRDWPDEEAAYQHFSGRGMFANFDPECLRDYVTAGTVMSANGVTLKFSPEVEYGIYCGLPHNFPHYRGMLKVPTTFIGSSRSNYVRKADLQSMRRHFGIRLQEVEGGHLFPFENPAMAANAVKAAIHS
ncbi:alpha/beta fold hydrolase [Chitinimonas sp. BJB300]|uniref:alpha/beta fold hydrolase n=1 Tax=Chitinimonas sp. BJB300 TaxID=1559339 RepID=UPI000C0DB8C6|nr:alpha/beta hydrolase [Chitinimonas sp. BJB300]PHV12938.1 alpha/beta hydrolase [Chitinimonas sp. BJB300]TSJ89110.1 alpha/beta hydrolase [Chitinimonas sp. BJB300]